MRAWKKPKFDKRGQAIVFKTNMLKSHQYLSLTAQAKVLMVLLQICWRADKAIDYGVREAAEKIPCSIKTASKAFKQLEERGFVTMIEYSMFSSRTQSKARSWRLEWMPFMDFPPKNTWEDWNGH